MMTRSARGRIVRLVGNNWYEEGACGRPEAGVGNAVQCLGEVIGQAKQPSGDGGKGGPDCSRSTLPAGSCLQRKGRYKEESHAAQL